MKCSKFWQKLFSSKEVTRDSLKNNVTNVGKGCFMLHRDFVKAEHNTVPAVRSLHNSHKAKYILKYGHHIKRAYNQSIWKK